MYTIPLADDRLGVGSNGRRAPSANESRAWMAPSPPWHDLVGARWPRSEWPRRIPYGQRRRGVRDREMAVAVECRDASREIRHVSASYYWLKAFAHVPGRGDPCHRNPPGSVRAEIHAYCPVSSAASPPSVTPNGTSRGPASERVSQVTALLVVGSSSCSSRSAGTFTAYGFTYADRAYDGYAIARSRRRRNDPGRGRPRVVDSSSQHFARPRIVLTAGDRSSTARLRDLGIVHRSVEPRSTGDGIRRRSRIALGAIAGVEPERPARNELSACAGR